MRLLENFPKDVITQIALFLEPRELFLFAQTSKRNNDIALSAFFSNIVATPDYIKACCQLCEYWVENPQCLIDKLPESRRGLKKWLEACSRQFPLGEVTTLSYSCLVILNLAEKNQAGMKEYLYRLYFASNLDKLSVCLLVNRLSKNCNTFSKDQHKHKKSMIDQVLSKNSHLGSDLLHHHDNKIIELSNLDPQQFLTLVKDNPEEIIEPHLKLLRIYIKKLTPEKIIESLDSVFNKLKLRKMLNNSKIILQVLDLYLFRLESKQRLNYFEKLLYLLPIIQKSAFKNEYTSLLTKLIKYSKDNELKLYLNKLNTALLSEQHSKKVVKFTLISQSQDETNDSTSQVITNNNENLKFEDFLEVILRLQNNLDIISIANILYRKLFKFCSQQSATEINKYADIAFQFVNTMNKNLYVKIQSILLMTLPDVDLVDHVDKFFLKKDEDPVTPRISNICNAMTDFSDIKTGSILNIGPYNAFKFFTSYFDNYLERPYQFSLFMPLIASKLDPQHAKTYLNLIIDSKYISAYGMDEVITALAKRAYLEEGSECVIELFNRMKNERNIDVAVKICYALKGLYIKLSITELKDHIPNLFDAFKQNPSNVINIINAIAPRLNDDEIQKCIDIAWNMLEKSERNYKIRDFCCSFKNKFTDQQINNLFEKHIVDVIQRAKYSGLPSTSQMIVQSLIPRLTAPLLLQLYKVNPDWANAVCSQVQEYDSEKIIAFYSNPKSPSSGFIEKIFKFVELLCSNPDAEQAMEEDNDDCALHQDKKRKLN